MAYYSDSDSDSDRNRGLNYSILKKEENYELEQYKNRIKPVMDRLKQKIKENLEQKQQDDNEIISLKQYIMQIEENNSNLKGEIIDLESKLTNLERKSLDETKDTHHENDGQKLYKSQRRLKKTEQNLHEMEEQYPSQ